MMKEKLSPSPVMQKVNTDSNGLQNGVTNRSRWNEPLRKRCFLNLLHCLWFIVENAINILQDNYTGSILNELLSSITPNYARTNDEFTAFEEFSRIMSINLMIWLVDNGRTYFRPFNDLIQRRNQQYYSFIVVDRQNASFNLIYMLGNDYKKHTVVSRNDPYVHGLFANFQQAFDRPDVLTEVLELLAVSQDEESENAGHQSTELLTLNTPSHDNDGPMICIDQGNLLQNLQDGNTNHVESNFFSTTTSTIPALTAHINQTIELPKPVLRNQPVRLSHHRYLTDGIRKPLINIRIEGSVQRGALEIEVTDKLLEPILCAHPISDDYIGKIYLGVRVVNYRYERHAQNVVVPAGTMVTENYKNIENKLQCFIFDKENNPDIFMEKDKCVYSKITEQEIKNGIKKMSIAMTICHDDTISQRQIVEKERKWSKLELTFYMNIRENEFRSVSPSTYTDLIQQTNLRHDAYRSSHLIREFLCENGGQIIVIELAEAVHKKDLFVFLNNKYFEETNYQLAENYLSFTSPPGTPETSLHILVHHLNNEIARKELFLPYRTHDNHLDPCDEH